MEFVDTHCHIHEASSRPDTQAYVHEKWAKGGFNDTRQLIDDAQVLGVSRLICVGCTLADSQMAVALAQAEANCWASVGIHPHEAKDHGDEVTRQQFADLLTQEKVVAIGEIGLDFYYNHSDKADQIAVLEFQLDLAQKHDLPVIFHVRDAFSDFWPIYDQFTGLRGVIHSFSSTTHDLEQILSRGLYVGLNGIMTFTKNADQIEAAKHIPLSSLLLETDAPFLTPAPNRSIICQPKHLVLTAEFLAGLRDESLEQLAQATTQNACNLFALK